MTEYHYQFRDGRRFGWRVERLLDLSRNLPVESYEIANIQEYHSVYWFDRDHLATCHAVVEHLQRIQQADLSLPILMSAEGLVMDGMHRIAKAHLEGVLTIPVRRFPLDPQADKIEDWQANG